MSEEKITLKAQMAVKESAEFKNLQHRAVAGLTEEELIERHTIGELKQPASGNTGATDTKGN